MNVEKKLTVIIVIMVIILIISGLGLFFYSKIRVKDYYFKYGNFDIHKVVSRNGIWYDIKIFIGEDNSQPYIISVRNDPRELENITLNIDDFKLYLMKPILYITMDKVTGLKTVAGIEISKLLGNPYLFRIPLIEGALTNELPDEEVLVKTCDDVDVNVGIIYLKDGIKTKIYEKEGCVIIEGKDDYEIIKGADRLVLTLLGIMKK